MTKITSKQWRFWHWILMRWPFFRWRVWLDNRRRDAFYKWKTKRCDHEWHADKDNYCNFCVKCGATQEIYTE